jgi:hypothetical protein
MTKSKSDEGKIYKVIAGSPTKLMKLGDTEIECYVLDNGVRVLSHTGMQRALGLSDRGGRLADYTKKVAIKPHLTDEVAAAVKNPYKFLRPESDKSNRTTLANGVEATVLKKICDAVLKARRENPSALSKVDEIVTHQAEILLGGFAEIGIIALVDEVTGYKKKKDEYQEILAKYVAKELQQWIKAFGEDYYYQIYRLKGWDWNRFAVDKKNHPWAVAHITNRIVYEKLPDGVVEALDELEPADAKGNRKHRLHQHLTPDEGKVHLLKHLGAIEMIMERHADGEWAAALHEIDTRFPSLRLGDQVALQLDYHVADKNVFDAALSRAVKSAQSEPKK